VLPATIKPMEPVLKEKPPGEKKYLHSVKWDGVRQIVFLEQDGIRIHNRKLRDRTRIYPELQVLKEMASETGVVFDGEVIALNEKGQPDFARVMRRDNCRSQQAIKAVQREVPVFYMIFDLLYHKGESIMHLPLSQRLEILDRVLPNPVPPVQIVEHVSGGSQLFERTRELGLEGVVSKDGTSRYLPGTKNRIWVKSKHYKDITVVVGGFTVKNGGLNSLSVGAYGEDNRLYYLGNVATGLRQADIDYLDKELRNFVCDTSPFTNFRKKSENQFWVMPGLTLKIKYLEMTSDGHLRHPVIMGFVSADPTDCRLGQ
jgi:bifunctional non-homologous end joining protein LigD